MTTALAYKTSGVPRLKVIRTAAPRIRFIMACTPQPSELVAHGNEYTDKQFYADLRKSSKRLDAMAAEALKNEAKGKTREFPV